jgi:hypothetical protein
VHQRAPARLGSSVFFSRLFNIDILHIFEFIYEEFRIESTLN